MKRLYFTELRMLSTVERRARKIVFDRTRTVIKGLNDTGKSSLIKTIYRTLGAEPPQIHPRWESADVRSALTFELEGETFTILRDGGRFTLFDSDMAKIESFDRITTQMSPFFARLFSFHLRLKARGKETQATPAFLFLPFYIDQDYSWTKAWSGFQKLQQFAEWSTDVVHYHTGIKPNQYYESKDKVNRANVLLTSVVERRALLERVLDKLEKKLARAQCDVDIESYQKEVERLLTECSRLQEEEEMLKEKLVSLYNNQSLLRSQVHVAESASKEFAEDYRYATFEIPETEVTCPTCGACYENSFAERFAIAHDEDRCREVLAQLRDELGAVDKSIVELRKETAAKKTSSLRLRQILDERREQVTLKDIIENEGKKEVQQILSSDMRRLEYQRRRLDGAIAELQRKMRDAVKRERQKEITDKYLEYMRRFLRLLDVTSQPLEAYQRMTGRLKETGSDLPRALLAYYFSILRTIGEFSASTYCPIVIDSPNQQDQDPKNLKKMLSFIKDQQPEGSQIILGLVGTEGIDFEGKVIELTTKRYLLREEEYDEVSVEMRPLLAASMQA
jgi:hypothetical protein